MRSWPASLPKTPLRRSARPRSWTRPMGARAGPRRRSSRALWRHSARWKRDLLALEGDRTPVGPSAFPSKLTVEVAPEDPRKLHYDKHLYQGVVGSCSPLSSAKLAQCRRAYFEGVGDHPVPAERPTDDQLSALYAWLNSAA